MKALSSQACIVVSDDFPCFFLPRMIESAGRQIPVRFELVDSNGILPLAAADKVFARAHYFRRFMQNNLRPNLDAFPQADPLADVGAFQGTVDLTELQDRWPINQRLSAPLGRLSDYPIDHGVQPVAAYGGEEAARKTLGDFVRLKLHRYQERNQPEEDVGRGLSPYLHFGHISTHEVFVEVMRHDDWGVEKLAGKATGSSRGWWGSSAEVESFLDELITWREVGFNMCRLDPAYDQYESLPNWAQKTLAVHAGDPRPHLYDLEGSENAGTHDLLWNAAQRQLVAEGRIHNYLRMLWGKKILEWSPSPQEGLSVMIELNNKYALDGRDPNRYRGIFWCLGRYDRAWGPERPIFGKVRSMSSANTARKLRVKKYLATNAAQSRLF